MGYIEDRRTRIERKIANLEAQLAIAEETYEDALARFNKKYTLDTSEGRQSTEKRTLDEIMRNVSYLERTLEYYYRKLNSNLLCNVNLRRK